jgi:Zn-dependent protease with chaperone function
MHPTSDHQSRAEPDATSDALPGPADREDFAAAERRHRRARRWYTAVCGLDTLMMGIPLAAVITPLAFLIALLGTDLLNLVVPMPDLSNVLDSGTSSATPLVIAGIVAGVLVPGALVHLAAWAGVRRLVARVGGDAALALGARDPRPSEVEEHQVANVVAEAAIACGIKTPRIQLIDTTVVNAAVIGSGVDDATIVVTTGLLETLNRDETQAVLAHAVGAAANGDLAIGTTITSFLQTIGLMSTVLSVPTSARSRRVVVHLFACTVHPGRDRARAARELAELVASTDADEDDGTRSRVLRIVLFPVSVAGGAYSLARSFYTSLLVDPLLRRGWCARKMLADATAVELTRNPDALVRALTKLADRADVLPGAAWASHLFVVGPEAAMARKSAVLQAHLGALPRGTARLEVFADPEAMTALAAMAKDAGAASFHPPLSERLSALRRLGATVETPISVTASGPSSHPVFSALFAPVRLLAFLFQLAVPLFGMVVALFLGLIYVFPLAALLHEVLRS